MGRLQVFPPGMFVLLELARLEGLRHCLPPLSAISAGRGKTCRTRFETRDKFNFHSDRYSVKFNARFLIGILN